MGASSCPYPVLPAPLPDSLHSAEYTLFYVCLLATEGFVQRLQPLNVALNSSEEQESFSEVEKAHHPTGVVFC